MPTYEYLCSGCGSRFEVFQRITEEPVKSCPECGGTPQRVISLGGGFLFKGSGFYATDYRSDSYKKKAKEESGSTAEKKPESKTPKD